MRFNICVHIRTYQVSLYLCEILDFQGHEHSYCSILGYDNVKSSQ
jgi:hypothetical protein